jgi:hypothetical protein
LGGLVDQFRGAYQQGLLAEPMFSGSTGSGSSALMRSLLGQGEYADSGMILPFAKTPSGENVLSFPAPIQAAARTANRAMGGMPLEFDPNTGLPSEDVLADAAEAAGLFTGAGLLAPKPSGAIGMSGGGSGVTRVIPPRQIDDLGFYSQALEAATMLPQAKGTGQQMEAMLLKAGVKPDEIAFTPGLRGLLDEPQVTREEVVALMQQNQIRPQETVLEGGDIFGESQLRFGDPEVHDLEADKGFYDWIMGAGVDDYMQVLEPDEVERALLYAGFDTDYAATQAAKADNANYPDEMTSAFDRLTKSEQSEIESAFADRAKAEYYEDPRLVWRDPDTDYKIIGNDHYGYEVYDPSGSPIRGEALSLNEARALATNAAYDAGDIGVGRDGDARFGEEGWVEAGGTNYRENLLQIPEYEGMGGVLYEGDHFDEPNIAVHTRTKDRNTESGVNDVLYVEELQSDWGQSGRQQGFVKPEDAELLDNLETKIEPIRQKMHKADDKVQSLRDRAIDDIASSLGLVRAESEVRPDFYQYGSLTYPDGSKAVGAADLLELVNGRKAAIYPNSGGRVDRFLGKDDLPDYYRKAVDEFDVFEDEFTPISEQIDSLEGRIQPAPLVGNTEKFTEAGIKRLLIQAANEGKRYVSFSPGGLQADRWKNPGLFVHYDEIIPKVAKKIAKRFDKDAFTGSKYIEDLGDRFTIEITPKMREAIQEGVPLFIGGGQGLLAAGEQMRQDRVQPKGIMF